MSAVVLGQALDYFFGPRVMNLRAAHYFLQYPGEQAVRDMWDSMYSPLVDCKYAGLTFGEVLIDFTYPEAQGVAESHDLNMLPRRTNTLHVIVHGLIQRDLFLSTRT